MKSNMEYYSDDAFVQKTLEDFLSLTVSDIARMEAGRDYITVSSFPINMEKFDRTACETMSYKELAGLIVYSETSYKYRFGYVDSDYMDILKKKHPIDYRGCSSQNSYLDEVSCLDRWIFTNYSKNAIIKRFMDIPVKRLYDILKENGNYSTEEINREYSSILNMYQAMYSDLNIAVEPKPENTLTIKEVLSIFRAEAKQSWNPGLIPDQAFACKVKEAIKMEGIILVKCFGHVFPESYDFRHLRSKYRIKNSLDDIPYDFDDELPFN